MVTKPDSSYVFRLQFLVFMYMYTLYSLLFATNAIKVSLSMVTAVLSDVFVFAVAELI